MYAEGPAQSKVAGSALPASGKVPNLTVSLNSQSLAPTADEHPLHDGFRQQPTQGRDGVDDVALRPLW